MGLFIKLINGQKGKKHQAAVDSNGRVGIIQSPVPAFGSPIETRI